MRQRSTRRQYLEEYCAALGWSSRKLAGVTGINRTTLLRMRSDPYYPISATDALTLSEALGITVEKLYQEPGGDGE